MAENIKLRDLDLSPFVPKHLKPSFAASPNKPPGLAGPYALLDGGNGPYYESDKARNFETVILSVKAGHTSVQHVRELRGVLNREQAATCVVYVSNTWGRQYPKMQLLTIAELLGGKQINIPPIKKSFKEAGSEL
ncbi:MAG: hypothetical protein K9M96_05240 [Deltaproteobacteria bacterium]|nr:hypothetical protein [Deltaproteobacteria bacterium]